MGKSKKHRHRRSQERRFPCAGCQKQLTVSKDLYRYLSGGLVVQGDRLTLVCNAKCEEAMYQGAKILNWLLTNDPVAYQSGAVLLHDRWMREGVGFEKKDDELVMKYGYEDPNPFNPND